MDQRIRHVIFITDKDTKYHLDVHCKTNILSLKKIIAAAANLNRKTLILVHEGIEYIETEERKIDQLFPNLPEIIFNVGFRREIRDTHQRQSITKINIGPKCERHSIKYLNHYCFTCNKSICNQCKEEDNHKEHNITDKMDFFSDSEVIVNDIFRNITSQLRNLNIDSQDEINNLRNQIKNFYFPNLYEHLKKIESNIVGFLDAFETNIKYAKINVLENVNNLESNCSEGLDELKNKISIKDILVNEEVFLTFNSKLIQMSEEQNRVIKEGENYNRQCRLIDDFAKHTQKLYKEIKENLDRILKFEDFEHLFKEMSKNEVQRINKEEIISHILSGTDKKVSSESISKDSNLRKSIFPSQDLKSSSNYNPAKVNPKSFPSPSKLEIKTQQIGKEDANIKISTIADANYKDFETNFNKSQIPKDKEVNFNSREDSAKKNKESLMDNSQNYEFASTMQEIIPPILNNSKKRFARDDIIIMRIFPETDQIAIYNNSDGQCNTISVALNPIIGTQKFYSNSHAITVNHKMYITGGIKEVDNRLVGTTTLLCYDYDTKSLKRLADMAVPRHSHSSIYYNDSLYVVGGHSNNTCEKFEIKALKWKPFPSLLSDERQTPILHVNENFLYAFFGYKLGKYLDNIERINLKINKKWEVLPFKNNENLDLKVVFSGLVPSSTKNEIYFFGGKSHNGEKEVIRKDGFLFNFDDKSFKRTGFELEDETFFHNSQLVNIDNSLWAQFNMKETNQLLKLEIN